VVNEQPLLFSRDKPEEKLRVTSCELQGIQVGSVSFGTKGEGQGTETAGACFYIKRGCSNMNSGRSSIVPGRSSMAADCLKMGAWSFNFVKY